jgi:hypothetical protein
MVIRYNVCGLTIGIDTTKFRENQDVSGAAAHREVERGASRWRD